MRLLALALTALALFAQSGGSKSAKKKAPAKQEQPTRDPEDRWICRIGSYHDCRCLAQVSEAQEEWVKKCLAEKDYDACMKREPSNCSVIQTADVKHPEHTCKRTCKAMAGCQCDDAPVCKGPTFQQQYDSSDEEQQ